MKKHMINPIFALLMLFSASIIANDTVVLVSRDGERRITTRDAAMASHHLRDIIEEEEDDEDTLTIPIPVGTSRELVRIIDLMEKEASLRRQGRDHFYIRNILSNMIENMILDQGESKLEMLKNLYHTADYLLSSNILGAISHLLIRIYPQRLLRGVIEDIFDLGGAHYKFKMNIKDALRAILEQSQ